MDRPSFLEARLADLAVRRQTGALEITDDKKKRVFFFKDGVLVATNSNLKSESAERVAERFPGVPAVDVPRIQAALRIGACTRLEAVQVEWSPGREAPRTLALSFAQVLWEGLEHGLDAPVLMQRILAFGAGNPVTEGDVSGLPVSARLREWLSSFDGGQAVGEVLQFAPEDQETCARALYLALLLGVVELRDGAAPAIEVSGTRGAEREVTFRPAGARGEPSPGSEDLSRLIAEGVGSARRVVAPSLPPSPPSPPPRDPPKAENLEAQAIREVIGRIQAAGNHFEVLGLGWEATMEEYRSAYFATARALHPDRLASQPDDLKKQATDAFEKARAAWEVLKDDEARQAYTDRVIHGKKTEDEIAMETVQAILEAETVFKRGLAAFNAGQVVKAHASFEDAWKKVPDEPEFAAYYGYTLYRTSLGRNEEQAEQGLQLLKQSLEKGKKMDGPWVLMGRIFRERDEEEKAKRCFVQALRINASNGDASRELERMKREKEKEKQQADSGKMGFLKGLFGRKKES